ncbi:MAG TPA: alpha/beta fold hydrolase [Vicinamibacterales bacterium]|jgi:pimeloyl-ACP methyl ester carboxylesterase
MKVVTASTGLWGSTVLQPVVLGPAARPLTGMLDLPSGAPATDAGVLVCAPLGRDNLHSYRSLRLLAARLAASGRPTLRFDWATCGDSAGATTDPGLVDGWIASVGEAVHALREATGVRTVSVVGVGIGATFALAAAAGGVEVDELVLWAPNPTGRSYLREQRALHRFAQATLGSGEPRPSPLPDGDEELVGYHISAETSRDLGEIDVTSLDFAGAPPRRALVLGRDDAQPDSELVAWLESLGIEVESSTGRELVTLVDNSTKQPQRTFDEIEDWLAPGAPSRLAAPVAQSTTCRPGGSVVEELVVLGETGSRIVGVVSTSDLREPREDDVWYVFLTTAHIRRAGPNRMWTRFARDLTARGVPCFRLDVEGVGDSDGPEMASTTLSTQYSPDVLASIGRGLDYLRTHHGARRFALVGLCSGAFNAFHTAVAEPDVVSALLVDPQTFLWTREVELEAQASYLRDSLVRVDRWRRVARGEVNLGRAARVAWRSGAKAVARPFGRLLPRRSSLDGRDPVLVTLEDGLERLASRNVDVLAVYWDEDPGLAYLRRHVPGGVDWLAARRGVRVQRVTGSGHTFLPLWAHDLLFDLLGAQLERLGSPTGPARAPAAV